MDVINVLVIFGNFAEIWASAVSKQKPEYLAQRCALLCHFNCALRQSNSIYLETLLHIIAVVRQQFEMGINYSIFLYRNSFRANQRVKHWLWSPSKLHRFHIVQFSGSSSRRVLCSKGWFTCIRQPILAKTKVDHLLLTIIFYYCFH